MQLAYARCGVRASSLLPVKGGTSLKLRYALYNERKMAVAFETCLRNFYRREERTLAVEPLHLSREAEQLSDTGGASLLICEQMPSTIR